MRKSTLNDWRDKISHFESSAIQKDQGNKRYYQMAEYPYFGVLFRLISY